jgi:hypothetical protein
MTIFFVGGGIVIVGILIVLGLILDAHCEMQRAEDWEDRDHG